MELALYHEKFGYYASGHARIGRNGDFFTNVSVGSIFGKLLAEQFAEIWEQLGKPDPFTIVEQGAHDGQFAVDVLSALHNAACWSALHYVIVEPFPVWRERQQARLHRFAEKVSGVESLESLAPFSGIHFSNELFDALPVHLFSTGEGDSVELRVATNDDRFEFEPCQSAREASLAAPKLMRDIAAKLSRGVIIAIDYGVTREQFSERKAGTLQVRAAHSKLASPFDQIGLADISAHVEWTSLIKAAQSSGAQLIGLTDQHHFLTGILSALVPPAELQKFSAADKRALQTLLHPEMLGRSFQALALAKNFSGTLSAFRYA